MPRLLRRWSGCSSLPGLAKTVGVVLGLLWAGAGAPAYSVERKARNDKTACVNETLSEFPGTDLVQIDR